jgi:hypothetical protein
VNQTAIAEAPLIAEPETIGTTEAAAQLGKHPDTLLEWVRDGKLHPANNGKSGRQRRYFWAPADLAEAQILADTSAMTSREAVEKLGPLVPHLTGAQVKADCALKGFMVACSGSAGVRTIRADEPITVLFERLGRDKPILIMPPTPADAPQA